MTTTNVLDIPLEVLCDIVNCVSDDNLSLLEVANVNSHFGNALYNRTKTVTGALKDMESKEVNISRETLNRLLVHDLQHVPHDKRPEGIRISIADKKDENPTFSSEVTPSAFSTLTWLTVVNANLEPRFLTNVLNDVDSIEYVELVDCSGLPFDENARVVRKVRPWTLRCVGMRVSLKMLVSALGPTGYDERPHLRYVVFVGCTVSVKRTRHHDKGYDRWLRKYDGTNRAKCMVRHMNLTSVSDRWKTTEPFDLSEVDDSYLLTTNITPYFEVVEFSPKPRLSKPGLARLISSTNQPTQVTGIRFAMDVRDGALDKVDALPFERLTNLTRIEIHDSEISDAFFDELMNSNENLRLVKLTGCTKLSFDDVVVRKKRTRWTLHIENMDFESRKLVAAVEPHQSIFHFSSLQIDTCRYDRSVMLKLMLLHGWLRVSEYDIEIDEFVDLRNYL